MTGDPLVSRLARGAVSRWTKPYPDEPPHGFLMRLAAAHRVTSAVRFAVDLGFREVTDAESCMSVIRASHHATEAQKEVLWHWAAKPVLDANGKGWHVIGGQTVRRFDFVIATRRFCPACLAEAAYHRAWFDLTFMVTCPLHGLPVTDMAEGGARVGWATTAVDMTSDGSRLSRAAPRVPDGEQSFEGYALGRLGLAEARPNPLLDEHRLGEVAEAVRLMGLLSLGGRKPRLTDVSGDDVSPQAITKAGYAVLARGVEGVTALFRDLVDQAPADMHGVDKLFGWAYGTFTASLPLALGLRDVMVDVAHQMGRAGTRSSRSRPMSRVGPSVTRLASENGLKVRDVTRVAAALGYLAPRPFGPKTPNIVPTGCVPMVLGGFRDAMTRERAAGRLAIDTDTFTEIVRSGYLDRFTAGFGGDRKDTFHFGSLIGFLEVIHTVRLGSEQLDGASASSLISLGEALAARGKAAGQLLDDIMCGHVKAFSRVMYVDDLNDILIEAQPRNVEGKACKPGPRSSRAPANAMTKREAATLLDVTTATIKLLLDHGYLGTLGGSKKRNMLDRGTVQAFGTKYLAGRYYASILDVNANHVSERLAKLGVKELLHEVRPGGRAGKEIVALYDRQVMRATLGLDQEPDVSTPGRRAWKRFATYLGKGRRGLMIWTVKGERSAVCADGAWEFVATLTVSEPGPDAGVPFAAEMTARDTDSRKVVATMAARAASRTLPTGLEYEVDTERGLLRAKVAGSIASWPEHREGADDAIDPSRERADFALMEETVLMLRATFEAEGVDDIVPRGEVDEPAPPMRRAG